MDMRWCWCFTALLLLSLCSCVHEDETTPLIHVTPGAAQRALWYDTPSLRTVLPPAAANAENEPEPSEDGDPYVQKTVATDHPVD